MKQRLRVSYAGRRRYAHHGNAKRIRRRVQTYRRVDVAHHAPTCRALTARSLLVLPRATALAARSNAATFAAGNILYLRNVMVGRNAGVTNTLTR